MMLVPSRIYLSIVFVLRQITAVISLTWLDAWLQNWLSLQDPGAEMGEGLGILQISAQVILSYFYRTSQSLPSKCSLYCLFLCVFS